MCTGKCSRCIAVTLYPLVFLSVLCNILLFFPGWSVNYAKQGHITQEVKYMGGVVGGGLLVMFSALYISMTGEEGCCGNRFGMFLSIVFAAVGVAGALYSFSVAMFGVAYGPLCKYKGTWTTPFKNSNSSYMSDSGLWKECTEPKNVVQFNLGLFFTLMAVSCLQVFLCGTQMVNGLFGCLCGTCIKKQEP